MQSLRNLPNRTKGLILMLVGVGLLLLYFFGVFAVLQKSINMIVVVVAVAAIIFGFFKMGGPAYISRFISSLTKK